MTNGRSLNRCLPNGPPPSAITQRVPGGRPRRLDLRQIMNALLYQARTGCQWRMLPQEFPAWQTVSWFDLAQRQIVAPPAPLLAALNRLERTSDFREDV